MSDIRQCWAYNVTGQRCDMPAGHPGDHGIQYTWSDDDCYSPVLAAAAPKAPVVPLPVKTQSEPVKCIACSHQHRGGECKCGCYEFIG